MITIILKDILYEYTSKYSSIIKDPPASIFSLKQEDPYFFILIFNYLFLLFIHTITPTNAIARGRTRVRIIEITVA